MDANKLPSLAALAVCTGANERSMVSSPKGEEEPAPAGAHGPSVFPLLFRSTSFLGFLKYIYIYIYWLCWVFVAACGLSLVVESRGYSLVVVHGLLIAVASLVAEHGLSNCGSRA